MTREDKRAYNYARDRLANDDYPVYSDEYELELAYKAGIEDAKNHPNWISVEDELPHAEQDNATNLGAFLFYTEPINENGSFEGRYRTGFYDRVTGNYKIRPNHFGNTRVTHWMPMPQPPKKGGEKW